MGPVRYCRDHQHRGVFNVCRFPGATNSPRRIAAATETAPEPEACHADPPNGADHVKMQRVSEPIAEEVEEAEEESTSEDEAVLDQ